MADYMQQYEALVEKFTTQLFYAQSIPIPNHNPIANPIPVPALVEMTRRLTEIDCAQNSWVVNFSTRAC